MSLHQIGELVGRLPKAFWELHPDVPWRGIRQTRNIISHEYIQIDLNIIWQTVIQSIPDFSKEIEDSMHSIADGKEPATYEKGVVAAIREIQEEEE
ncbi:MAG: DUF86 domain-containing protein [Eubacteriaceae bacterium]|jgi:uncharacterized protein with HEPN domain|nr:DUF86 domain-containing protein [Eubacteriaceae bacterium]